MPSNDAYFVGAMPPELFLDRFMEHKPAGVYAPAPVVDFSKLGSAGTVRDISETLIRAVEKHKVCPTLRLFITKVKKRNAEINSSNRNGRHNGYADGTNAKLPDSQTELCPPLAVRTQRRSRRAVRTKHQLEEYHDFATAELGFATLCSPDEDPFCDPEFAPEVGDTLQDCAAGAPAADASPGVRCVSVYAPQELSNGAPKTSCAFEKDTPGAAATRSRLEAYAGASFARQHRRFLFQAVVIGDQARLLRWDRSGCIVSARFSVIHTLHLADFLWRFDHMDAQQRGWDSTATLATRIEMKLFEDAVRDFIGVAEVSAGRNHTPRKVPNAEETLDSTDTYPTWKIRVAHEDTHEATELVVRRPFAGHRAMFGRATRAYLALDLSTSRLVFLKDSWRLDDRRVRPEFRIYQELRSRDIPFIPYPMYGGDVQDSAGIVQETLGQVVAAERNDWHVGATRLDGHVHHRLVQDIAYRLDSVRDERELMQVIHDALTALDRAYSELGLIHRDISTLNVMITGDGKCMLSDWDHAGTLDQRARGVGTFQFMSARLLASDGVEINEHLDDLESIFWVLLYISLVRFAIPWNKMPLNVFGVPGRDGWHDAGRAKRIHLYCSKSYRGRFTSNALAELLRRNENAWGDYYVFLEADAPSSTDPPRTPEELKRADAVKQPLFFIEMLADAICQYDAEQAEAAARPLPDPLTLGPYALLAQVGLHPHGSPPASGTAVARTGVKRVAPTADENGENPAEPHLPLEDAPRRSKRLKTKHGRS
ncbi:hypothetical protein PsYK624_081640 [Phanerochaete sordida]|uniref:Protein kinase domain-containing protein n=1 Tax=Phanerochaete sordida TaxID=48140 RepID=A0A9P3GC21_9APHY|nr:hypothetical protein PsYK624_081640 [Phanerochaete sordida]